MKRHAFMIFWLVFFAKSAWATTCVQPGDWVPELCDLKVAPETRCALLKDNMVARNACAAQTVGCAEIGGCFGFVPPSHWWPMMDGGETKRCVCGCFAEETLFLAESGPLSGSDLIRFQKDGETQTRAGDGAPLRLYGLADRGGKSLAAYEVNGIIHGSEKNPVYILKTSLGRRIVLSDQHPVLIVDKHGSFSNVKAASRVTQGEHVLTDDGRIDVITSIKTESYGGQMVNFNVKSTDPMHHFVAAGGLILGDHAWQERLASTEARILQRADLLRALHKEGAKL